MIRIVPVSGSGMGLGTQTNLSCFPCATAATVDARGLTIVGDGSAGTVGVSSNSSGSDGTSASVTMRNSIIHGVQTSIARYAESGATVNTTSNVDVDWSNYDPGTVTSTGPGTLTQGPNNLNVDPMFADAGAFNFRLRAESPLVERGDPAGLAAGESTTDRDGASRVFDGNGDCAARRDIGAFELHPAQRAPVGTATGTPDSGGVGTPFTFAASGCDPDGDAVSYRWSFDDGGTATGATAQHSFATPGIHSATVTISDPGGRTLAITKTVAVSAAPRPLRSGLRVGVAVAQALPGRQPRDGDQRTQGHARGHDVPLLGLGGGHGDVPDPAQGRGSRERPALRQAQAKPAREAPLHALRVGGQEPQPAHQDAGTRSGHGLQRPDRQEGSAGRELSRDPHRQGSGGQRLEAAHARVQDRPSLRTVGIPGRVLDVRKLGPLLTDAPAQVGRPAHVSAASGLVRCGSKLYVVADDEVALAMFDADDPSSGRFEAIRRRRTAA